MPPPKQPKGKTDRAIRTVDHFELTGSGQNTNVKNTRNLVSDDLCGTIAQPDMLSEFPDIDSFLQKLEDEEDIYVTEAVEGDDVDEEDVENATISLKDCDREFANKAYDEIKQVILDYFENLPPEEKNNDFLSKIGGIQLFVENDEVMDVMLWLSECDNRCEECDNRSDDEVIVFH